MSKTQNLFRRNGTYYYRVRVPLDLVESIGKSEVKKSLGTSDYNEAKKRRNTLAVEFDEIFNTARDKKNEVSPNDWSLTKGNALELAREYFDSEDEKARVRDIEEYHSTTDTALILSNLCEDVRDFKDTDDPGTQSITQSIARKILSAMNVELQVTNPVHDVFLEYLRRALVELTRREIARLKQDYTDQYTDVLFAPSPEKPKAGYGGNTLRKVAKSFLEDYATSALAKGQKKRSVAKMAASIKLVEASIGGSRPIKAISRADCRQFRDLLAKLPANMGKRYPGVSLAKIPDLALKDGLDPMSYETQLSYLQALGRLMKWAFEEELIPTVPSAGLSPLAIKQSANQKRDPFDIDRLNEIFRAPLYTGCQNDGAGYSKPGLNVIRRSRFWIPLIGLAF